MRGSTTNDASAQLRACSGGGGSSTANRDDGARARDYVANNPPAGGKLTSQPRSVDRRHTARARSPTSSASSRSYPACYDIWTLVSGGGGGVYLPVRHRGVRGQWR